jgi:hypothetical protein
VHARAGGDAALASAWLARVSALALGRFDVAAAEHHADEAVALDPSPAALAARATVRMALFRLEEAAVDADAAVAAGGGPDALEVAGWVAYYRRRYDDARRYADEAGCLSLAGRTRHGAGDLAGAAERLEVAVDGPVATRSVAAVWLAAVRLHQGRAADALAVLDGAALDAASHPFVPLHGRFARAVALGTCGRAVEALAAADDLLAVSEQAGAVGTRFTAVGANLRGWVLRWAGRVDEADDETRRGLAISADASGTGPATESMSEPFWVGRLDLADGRLLAGDHGGAAAIEATLDGLDAWNGTMAWHQRHRLGLLRARLALLDDDRDRAAALAEAVRADAAARGARRYEVLAAALVGCVLGRRADLAHLDGVVAELARAAGLDGWRAVAELAAATGVDRWAREAETRRAAVSLIGVPSP